MHFQVQYLKMRLPVWHHLLSCAWES